MIISDGINHGKLQSIIVGELKKAGLKHRLKKIILKNVKDNKTVFGAPLVKVPSCSVICCGSTLSVPMVVSEMSSVLRANAQIEGLFRKAGSQTRQKDIKRLLDAGGCVSDGHHPIDVASVLKLYLRCLPEPLISAEVQELLLRCRLAAGDDGLKPILHTLLLLPVLHVHLLHYIMELLNFIASRHKDNLMDSSNLAIVLAPSIMPLPAASTAQRLEHHVALVKIFIENAQHIGILTEDLMTQLDDDSDVYLARRKKRRSGSLNRVLSGLRKMVSGHAHTPSVARGKTPVLSKSAAKRKFDNYEGLSSKTKKEIKQNLPQKELLAFTPMKIGLERKRLRLSLAESRTPPPPPSPPADAVDLSPAAGRDYVRISKTEYEEIKSRVSAIESRLSREFTEPPEPLRHVQSAYEHALGEAALLHCASSDHLARRLSKELKIRPSEQAKIIRSPSARKIGSIRRRSKENVTKIVRHKSWNVPSQAGRDADRFYPYIGFGRERTSTVNSDIVPGTVQNQNAKDGWNASASDNSMNNTFDSSQKYQLRKRPSLAADCNLNKTIGRPLSRRSLNVTDHGWDRSGNSTVDSSDRSDTFDQHVTKRTRKSPAQQKWRSAAAFFMGRAGEPERGGPSGRPSVNKLRRQNAGAVLAKAKMFESSSDRSSEALEKPPATFARRPRLSGPAPPARLQRQHHQSKEDLEHWRTARKSTPPARKVMSPPGLPARKALSPSVGTPRKALSPPAPPLRKPLCPRSDPRRPAPRAVPPPRTPLRGAPLSPRRRSPRQKLQRYIQ